MVSHGETVPFEINGPGDYEIKDIFIKGIMTETTLSGKKYINTIYTFTIDNISICFLGCISEGKLGNDILGQIESSDIVFLPVGNSELLSASDAYKLAVSLESKVIIPMDYDDKTLKVFLKESGEESVKPVDKLTIKAKDLVGREGDVIVLSF